MAPKFVRYSSAYNVAIRNYVDIVRPLCNGRMKFNVFDTILNVGYVLHGVSLCDTHQHIRVVFNIVSFVYLCSKKLYE